MGYPEERVQEFDQGRVGQTRVELIATDRALYVCPSSGGTASRFKYEEIAQVAWAEQLNVLTVGRWSGSGVRVEIPSPTGLAAFVVKQTPPTAREP